MEMIICQKCMSIQMVVDGTLFVDIPLPGSALEAGIKCGRCGDVITLNIINKLQGASRSGEEEQLLINFEGL